ncbi:MAG: CRISPR-associated endonuclease Cas2 [Bacteroidetes bacterium]|nr:CRISPR-associated endonuclease Cas2 [Bacteroidota bacterium]MBS1942466.1 CRISPR-associated endonuclease Cas2 [Bacteroidota bacterium]
MSHDRYSAYRVMWLFVMFDLPTETKRDRQNAAQFRKRLLEHGFTMMQFSIYLRHCASKENGEAHRKRVLALLPPHGMVNILAVTDKQFGSMEIYLNTKQVDEIDTPQQLELF